MLIIDAFLGKERQRTGGGEEAKQRGVEGFVKQIHSGGWEAERLG